MKCGFSLVELSIVLVILGLLTGGILAGQSLIRAAELRAVSTEYSRYSAALQTFRDKYFHYPGDFRDATRFWGRMVATGDCATNSAAAVNAAGACDGNGDGVLVVTGAGSASEVFQVWRHLAAAGLVEGSYTGLAGPSHAQAALRGTNTPASRLSQALWYLADIDFTGSVAMFQKDFGNAFTISGENSSSWPTVGVMRPEEAWNVDTKLDDGHAAQGKVWAIRWNECTTATSETDFQNYDFANTASNACGLVFQQQF